MGRLTLVLVPFVPTVVTYQETPKLENFPSTKPSANDLGFVHTANQRWIWPIEAKVLSTSAALAEYLNDVRSEFVTGIAGPFVARAAGLVIYSRVFRAMSLIS